MHAAVFLPKGSIKTLHAVLSVIRSLCFSPITAQVFSGGANERTRSRVSSSIERLVVILRNCFGSRSRLAGQNRVPDPPAMITANIVNLSESFESKRNMEQNVKLCHSRMVAILSNHTEGRIIQRVI